jgi:hypothetical protein
MSLPGLNDIESMAEDAVRQLWKRLHRKDAPAWPLDLLRMGCAYEQQRRRGGGLSRALRAELRKMAAGDTPKAGRYRPGTALVREWHGTTHSVAVADDGFHYDGRHYTSLSAIAREITGTRWSGPRFFGVRA